jgi:hypothetical protein
MMTVGVSGLPAWRGGVVACTRLLETLAQPPASPVVALGSTAAQGSVAGANNVLPEQQQSSNNHDKVLGVLSSLLQQQGQQQQAQQQQAQQQQQPSGSRHWPTGDELSSSLQGCQPDLSAASSGQVRMESQLVFDSCWRRFRERHDMVRFIPPRAAAAGVAAWPYAALLAQSFQLADTVNKTVCMTRGNGILLSLTCSLPGSWLTTSSCLIAAPSMQDFTAPREIVWLNGAPGSGKVGVLRSTSLAVCSCCPAI